MKILERHILGEFAKVLLVTAASLIALFLIIDIVENADRLIENAVPSGEAVKFFLFKIPAIIPQVFPMAVLISVLLSLGILNRYGEITAIKAGGIGLIKVLRPLIVTGIVISGFVMVVNEAIAPPAKKAVDRIEKRRLGHKEPSHFGREGLWFKYGSSIYNVRTIDVKRKTLHGINAYGFERPFRLKQHVTAKSAEWKDGWWVGRDAVVLKFADSGEVEKTRLDNFVFADLNGPEALLTAEKNYERMDLYELRNYIKALEAEGYDTSRYLVEFYTRVSFPLVNLIMVLVAIPFALTTGRKSGIAAGVGTSVIIGLSYWIIFGLSKSLGQTGVLPAVVAAFFPDLLFIAIGALMFGYVRQ
ncbi:MAG: LPS export ABC transporter permease LptG [Deltaproteobacteria bacterium]|nr:LPS export ABC transporter permease LptG [Deltaproteobacteria bacterium]